MRACGCVLLATPEAVHPDTRMKGCAGWARRSTLHLVHTDRGKQRSDLHTAPRQVLWDRLRVRDPGALPSALIVPATAKIDELMALCDTLKTHLNAAETTKLQLADAMAEVAVD